MTLLRAFVTAFSTFSKIPMPSVEWNEDNLKYQLCFFPLIGVVIGFLEYILLCLYKAYSQYNPFLYGILAIFIPFLVTGGIHLDGYMDTTDALASHLGREKKSEILKDPCCGSFSVIHFLLFSLLSLCLWSSFKNYSALWITFTQYTISRAVSGLVILNCKSSKNSGMAYEFKIYPEKKTVGLCLLMWIIVAEIILLWISPLYFVSSLAVNSFMVYYYIHMAYSQFGGISGDLAGWYVTVSEFSALVLSFFLSI